MALSSGSLKALIVSELDGQGFDTGNEHSWANKLATAIANAVVDHITAQAEVNTSGGHGQYVGPGIHSHPPGSIK